MTKNERMREIAKQLREAVARPRISDIIKVGPNTALQIAEWLEEVATD